jgi:hypothetical protein
MVVLVGSPVCPGGGTNCSAIGTGANREGHCTDYVLEAEMQGFSSTTTGRVEGARPG